MNEVEVNHVEPELAGARVEGAQRLIIAVTVIPELGRYEEVIPRHHAVAVSIRR